jgi:hypothetical protein
MSRATIDLLLSTDFLVAALLGAIGLAMLVVWKVSTGDPFPVGGVVLTTGAVLALVYTGQFSPLLLVGLVVLAVGGLAGATSGVVRFAAAVPGAALIGLQLLDVSLEYLPAVAAVMIAVLAPLVASFDRTFSASTMASPLVAVSCISVFFVVPDTEIALVVAGAGGIWLLSGPPAMITRLGGAGAYAVTGLLVWAVAVGGQARPVSLVAGFATLGLLVAVPFVLTLGSGTKRAAFAVLGGGTMSQYLSTGAVQIAIGLLMTVVVRVGRGNIAMAVGLAIGVLAFAGISVVSVWDPGSPVDPGTPNSSVNA